MALNKGKMQRLARLLGGRNLMRINENFKSGVGR